MKKVKQIAQQNVFGLFTQEERLISCDIARQCLLFQRTQKLAKLQEKLSPILQQHLPPPQPLLLIDLVPSSPLLLFLCVAHLHKHKHGSRVRVW